MLSLLLAAALSLAPAETAVVSGCVSEDVADPGTPPGYVISRRINTFGDTADYHVVATKPEQESWLKARVGGQVKATGRVGTRSSMRFLIADSLEEVR